MASSSSFSSTSPIDSDWELTNSDDITAEWILTGDDEGYYIPGRSISGVFSSLNHTYTSFYHLSLTNPCNIPPSFALSSSSGGLLLSCGPWSSYLVSNPSAGTHSFLPKPPGPHHPGLPLALVVDGLASYHVVCAVGGSHNGSYSFTTFSSSTGSWRASKSVFEMGSIVPNTGVSSGSSAYWRMEEGTIAAYDVVFDRTRILIPPLKMKDNDMWQLCIVGGSLCVAIPSDTNFEVYGLAADEDRWSLLCSIGIVAGDEEWDGGEPIVCKGLPWALRSESRESEVVMVVNGKVVVLGMENRKMRVVDIEQGDEYMYSEYVSYIDDPLASVDFAIGNARV